MQPAQIKPTENFLHRAKIEPSYFAGQIKRDQSPSNEPAPTKIHKS